ncbi:RAWUL domain [Phytophthora cactorum]|nr:RAWUL domain [Phytophthora cactorum]
MIVRVDGGYCCTFNITKNLHLVQGWVTVADGRKEIKSKNDGGDSSQNSSIRHCVTKDISMRWIRSFVSLWPSVWSELKDILRHFVDTTSVYAATWPQLATPSTPSTAHYYRIQQLTMARRHLEALTVRLMQELRHHAQEKLQEPWYHGKCECESSNALAAPTPAPAQTTQYPVERYSQELVLETGIDRRSSGSTSNDATLSRRHAGSFVASTIFVLAVFFVVSIIYHLPVLFINNRHGKSSSAPREVLASSLDDAACLFVEARTETLRMANINEFFICKLCKGYFRDPYTSKECLHTFCYGCTRGYYLYHSKLSSCPTCKLNLGAKPLTKFLWENANALERFLIFLHAERTYYQKFGIKRKQSDTPSETQPSPPKISRSLGPSPGNMIRFELYPQRGCADFYSPDVPLFLALGKLEAPYMYTQSLLKIMYLRKYLAKKLKVAKPEEIEILCKGTVVGPEYSLEFIRRTRWEENSKMVLEYRRQLVAS